jgi:hypothetical protein
MATHKGNARAPAASRHELENARREIEKLRNQGSLLIRRTALLAQEVARALQSSDAACRYGGDEFVILLPQCAT